MDLKKISLTHVYVDSLLRPKLCCCIAEQPFPQMYTFNLKSNYTDKYTNNKILPLFSGLVSGCVNCFNVTKKEVEIWDKIFFCERKRLKYVIELVKKRFENYFFYHISK